MSELPVSIWEIQWIFNTAWPVIKEKFFYGFHSVVKANWDHIEIALDKLESDVNAIMDWMVRDVLNNGRNVPQWFEWLLRSISTVSWFESQSEQIMNTPIVWQLLELYIFQDEEFKKILTRAEHAMDSFMKIYRKESLRYAESWSPNIKLLNKERNKLVKMAELCMRDVQFFFNSKILDLIGWTIIQSIKSPTPQIIDIDSIQSQFSALEQKDYYKEISARFNEFLGEIIGLITVE